MRILTIGGYGFTEARFLGALKAAGVDVLVDVRQRRGVRGARYAFLNSAHLQAAVTAAGIGYVHARELAPTTEIRNLQKREDLSSGTAKRDRMHLSSDFVREYQDEILSRFNVAAFRQSVGSAQALALFCVESVPEACHRSLAAEHLARALGEAAPVEHLGP